MLFLQLVRLALVLVQSAFQCEPFDQHGLPDSQRDGGVGDALAVGEKKTGQPLKVVLMHPVFQIDVAYRQIRGVDQCGIA